MVDRILNSLGCSWSLISWVCYQLRILGTIFICLGNPDIVSESCSTFIWKIYYPDTYSFDFNYVNWRTTLFFRNDFY